MTALECNLFPTITSLTHSNNQKPFLFFFFFFLSLLPISVSLLCCLYSALATFYLYLFQSRYIMSSFSKIFSILLAFSALAGASPVPSCPSIPEKLSAYEIMVGQCSNPPLTGGITHPTGGLAKERIHPTIYDVFPQKPELFKNPVGGLHLETYNTASQVEQVFGFKNIPANAKNCQLNVTFAAKADRLLITNFREASNKNRERESHLINIYPLPRYLTDGRVSYNSVKDFTFEANRIAGLELNGWDVAESSEHSFSYGIPCAGELWFKLAYRQRCNEKSVYLHQDERNGVFLHYDL